MDASQITQLLQKQNTRYINRSQTVDSSTLTWKNQIQSSKYIKGVKTCGGEQNCNVPTQPACPVGNGNCNYGGQGKQTTIMTGSTQQYPNVLAGASGSASQVYSSENITLLRAGINSCGVPGVSPAPENSYVILPACYCSNTNGPTASCLETPCVPGNPNDVPVNNQSNPYLPPFDTYYRFKNPIAQCGKPIQDQNQKHFVKQCHTRFPNANNGVNVLCTDCVSLTCNGCIIEPLESYVSNISDITYTVTYSQNDGVGNPPTDLSLYPPGATVTVLGNTQPSPLIDFYEWNTAADESGTSYVPGSTFIINANTILYAIYRYL